jgi:hypothetical protein
VILTGMSKASAIEGVLVTSICRMIMQLKVRGSDFP